MDLDDIKIIFIIGLMVILSILALVLPIVICVEKGEQREFELEKMKIQMQVYGEETNQNVIERE